MSGHPRGTATLSLAGLAGLVLLGSGCGSPTGLGGADQDGLVGGSFTFDVTVDDGAFSPSILKAQNLATVTVKLTNQGASAHGFHVKCQGGTCFPKEATIAPIAPNGATTATFDAPVVEGLFEFDTGVPHDVPTGQFIVE